MASPASHEFRARVSLCTSGWRIGALMRRGGGPGEIENCLSGSERGLVASELLSAPVPFGPAHRARHHQIVREASFGRAFGTVLGSGAENLVMASRAEPLHQLFVVEPVGKRTDVIGRGRGMLQHIVVIPESMRHAA